MRHVFLDKANLVVKEIAQPILHDHSILVSVHYTYVSEATRLSFLNKDKSFFSNVPHKVKRVLESVAAHAVSRSAKNNDASYQASMGYACSGHVISVGKKVKRFAPGDFIAAIDPGNSPHAELICIPEQCAVKLNNKKYLKEASMTALAAHGMQALRRAKAQIGETIAIMGMDVVGLLAVQLGKRAGCRVIAIDNDLARLEMAKNFGADFSFDFTQEKVSNEVDLITERHGVDAIIVTEYKKEYLPLAPSIVRDKGKIVLLNGEGMHFEVTALEKDIDVLLCNDSIEYFSQRAACLGRKRWNMVRNMQACIELVEKEELATAPFIQEKVDYKHVQKAINRIEKKLIVGCVLSYEQDSLAKQGVEKKDARKKGATGKEIRFIPAKAESVCVGMLGLGEFSQNIALPHIHRTKKVCIEAISDPDMNSAMHVARKFKIGKMAMEQDELFLNEKIDAVVIASDHDLHAEHALKALEKGKAVYLETPMATNVSQLERLVSFLEKHPTIPFAVNYGLSHSPFIQKIKRVLETRRTPIIAHYRLNRELSRKQNNMVGDMGAGRIIGEACQIVDLFCFLTDAVPVSISVEAMHSTRDDIFPTDNLSAQISFSDGSVCSFTYTTLGNLDIGNDRLELFYDNKSILMEDYMELYGFGMSSWFNETSTKAERGDSRLFNQFLDSLQKKNSEKSVDIEYLKMVAEVTLIVDALACEGGGKREL